MTCKDAGPVILINPKPVYEGRIAVKVFPPMGLLYLAAAVRRAGIPVRVVDANATGLEDGDILEILKEMDPSVIGLPVFAETLPAAARLVSAIRESLPGVRLVAGGPQATNDPWRILEQIPGLDHVICGEAEISLIEYISAVRESRIPSGIAGLCSRPEENDDEAGLRTIPAAVRITDLDRIPFPDRESIADNYARRLYYTVLVPDRRLDCMVTSRGCPHRCAFCYNWRFRQTWRSIDSCLQEIDMLVSRGTRVIEILDDNFTADRDRASAILERIAAEKWPVRFRIKARADAVDERLMASARRAGVYQVSIGGESGDPDMLKAMNKRITPDQIASSVRSVMSNGIYCHVNFIVGFPGETQHSMDRTVRLIRAVRPTSAGVDILVPYPGTRVYDQAKSDGTLVGDWSTNPDAEKPWVKLPWTDSRQDLVSARQKMMFRIYWNPTYMFRYAGMILGGINPTMARFLVQEAVRTLPVHRGSRHRGNRTPDAEG